MIFFPGFLVFLFMYLENYLLDILMTWGSRTTIKIIREHPFKTSAFLRGEGVKNWSNLPTNSSKKLPTEGGWGQK